MFATLRTVTQKVTAVGVRTGTAVTSVNSGRSPNSIGSNNSYIATNHRSLSVVSCGNAVNASDSINNNNNNNGSINSEWNESLSPSSSSNKQRYSTGNTTPHQRRASPPPPPPQQQQSTTQYLRSAMTISRRTFATESNKTTTNTITDHEQPPTEQEPDTSKSTEQSFRDTLKRLQQREGKGDNVDNDKNIKSDDTNTTSSESNNDEMLRKAADWWSSFTEQVSATWRDLINAGERKSINKKIIHPHDTPGGDQPYTGPVDIMVIDPSEKLSAWERMQKRLSEAPIIQDILLRTEEFYEKSGAKKVKERVEHLSEDAREAWETSQNPWVYRVSSVYETLTADTPETLAVAELRKLDPEFTLDDWRQDVVEHTLPQIMKWFLEGKINQLKPWLGEGVFKRLAAEMKAREQEGVQIDTHVLGIMNSEILACEPDEINKGSPIIILHFMCQQINCVRKKDNGEIVEGSEDDIRANSYVVAFQREYNEVEGELNWKIVDFRFNGAIAYL